MKTFFFLFLGLLLRVEFDQWSHELTCSKLNWKYLVLIVSNCNCDVFCSFENFNCNHNFLKCRVKIDLFELIVGSNWYLADICYNHGICGNPRYLVYTQEVLSIKLVGTHELLPFLVMLNAYVSRCNWLAA